MRPIFLLLDVFARGTFAAPVVGSLAPSLAVDFPDPSIIQTKDAWYTLGTTAKGFNVQIGKSNNFYKWNLLAKDAMPQLPGWVHKGSPQIWAPDVIQNDAGKYVLYFSAALAAFPDKHCVGAAISPSVEGPFVPLDKPFVCPDPNGEGSHVDSIVRAPGVGGAIDASGFRDTDGSRYVIWKVDGNSLAGGGPCGNGGPDRKPTPLMMIKVGGDGITPQGVPVHMLDRADVDGPLIEAPSLTRLKDGFYALIFSSNCWNTPNYDISWAKSRSITGPYIRQKPLLLTGQKGLEAPGGASISPDGRMVFHAGKPGMRAMYSTTIDKPDSFIRFTT